VCDTMVRVEPGRVLFAKNSDRDPNEAQALSWYPAADHAPDATVRCTYLSVPQVAHTHAVLLSRPYWMWGAEMGTNEHGVTIGNEAVFTDQPYAKTGLTGMDLLRLALERADRASAAVEVLTTLLGAHGQGGGCGHEDRSFTYHNSFLVADGSSAYVLETAGSRWAVEEVTAGARSISNGLTIAAFADQHADRLRGRVSGCAARQRTTTAAAGRAEGPRDLAAALRDHGGSAVPRYRWHHGGLGAPCVHAGGLLASSQTTASWIGELTPDGGRHWATATAAPCTGLFKPVAVDEPLDLGAAPTDVADPTSPWWRHERLHRTVARDPAALLPLYVEERDEVEGDWFASPPASEVAFAEADAHTTRWTAAVHADASVPDRRPAYVRRYWRIRDERAGLAPGSTVPVGA
jgi:secernin